MTRASCLLSQLLADDDAVVAALPLDRDGAAIASGVCLTPLRIDPSDPSPIDSYKSHCSG